MASHLLIALVLVIEIVEIRCSGSTESDDLWKIVAFALFLGILLMLLFVACLLWKLLKLKNDLEDNLKSSTPGNNENLISSSIPHQQSEAELISNNQEKEGEWGETWIADECDDLNLERRFEIRTENLEVLEVINRGYFSVVHRGELKRPWNKNTEKRLEVAVKGALNHQDCSQQRMILDELNAMCEIGKHPNVLALVGFVVNSSQMLIVAEYAERGSLLDYLRSEIDSIEYGLRSNDNLLSFAYQIANGMKYLASISYVHRQLALRNIFLTADGIIRIGELALLRRHGNNEYYRMMNKELPLSFHHMAPETFNDHKFTEKSDVWSYGVCLYELFSLGKFPYEGVLDVLTYLKRGRRLEQPERCPSEIYNFMLTCWDMEPDNRPSFAKCVKFFEEYLMRDNVEFLKSIKKRLELSSIRQEKLDDWIRGDNEDSGDSV